MTRGEYTPRHDIEGRRFGALVDHTRFLHDHHAHVKKIAVVTDSHLGDLAERLDSHFVAAEVHQFPAGQAEQARDWITGVAASPGPAAV